MSKKIYVGNLPFQTTEEEVRELFEAYGTIESIAMITDRDTGRFRGFCFIEMETSEADAAIAALDGTEVGGRNVRVNEARPRRNRGGQRGGRRRRDDYGRGGDFPDSGGGRRSGSRRRRRDDYGRGNDFPDSGGGRRW